MNTLILVVYIFRILISIISGFMTKSLYHSISPQSDYYIGKRPILYHKPKYFIIWCIPFYGWIWYIIFYNIKKTKNIFFNE
jgi:hypothetical protein